MNDIKIKLPNGYSISCENADPTKSQEGFGLKKDKQGYKDIDDFFNRPETKSAVEQAKRWLSKSRCEAATINDVKNLNPSLLNKILGFTTDNLRQMGGKYYNKYDLVFLGWMYDLNESGSGKPTNFSIVLITVKPNGKLGFKYFAVGAKIRRADKDIGLESALAGTLFEKYTN